MLNTCYIHKQHNPCNLQLTNNFRILKSMCNIVTHFDNLVNHILGTFKKLCIVNFCRKQIYLIHTSLEFLPQKYFSSLIFIKPPLIIKVTQNKDYIRVSLLGLNLLTVIVLFSKSLVRNKVETFITMRNFWIIWKSSQTDLYHASWPEVSGQAMEFSVVSIMVTGVAPWSLASLLDTMHK